jgi:MSHA biogenesis protein MshK
VFKAYFNSLLTTSLLVVVIVLTSSVSLAADVDPTRPFGVSGTGNNNQVKRDGGFILTSIIHGDGIHTAVINGKIYKMFDYVGEYRITAINSHNVILRSKSKRLKINVFKSKGFKSNVVENTVAN